MFHIDIVEQCKKHNRKAQLKLYKQYCHGMFAVAMRFLKNEDDAEDMVQEAFIKAFEKIHQYQGEVSFGAWLKKIVINKCLDFLKAKKEHLESLDERYVTVVEDDDWTVDDDVSIDEIKKAITFLSDKYKYVLQLFLMEGYDHAEISEILNISETACRTRLLRGKGQLKSILIKENYGARS